MAKRIPFSFSAAKRLLFAAPAVTFAGCMLPSHAPPPLPLIISQKSTPKVPSVKNAPPSEIQLAAFQQSADGIAQPMASSAVAGSPVTSSTNPGLPELLQVTMANHPRLSQVTWAVESARGRAQQAGLYPNPTISLIADELGDRQGPGGILSLPNLTQEIVRGGKLKLSQAVAMKEVDQATWDIVVERYKLFTDVRRNYVEVVTLQRRVEVLQELITLAEQSVSNAEKLLKAKEGSELDVVQLEVDRERYRAELESTQRSIPAAFRRLAASTGMNDLPETHLPGDLELPLPQYDLEQVKSYVLAVHPELKVAQTGIERARLLVRRAEVEPIPNITVGASYVRQNQNKSNDYSLSASMPIPVWNKNEGNIRAARAQLNEAMQESLRVQTDLSGRVASSFAIYTAARARAEKYKTTILPKAAKSLELARKAYLGGQFEYLRVLQSQRAVPEARLEYLRSLGEMWRAASEIAGFTLEDQWPPVVSVAPSTVPPITELKPIPESPKAPELKPIPEVPIALELKPVLEVPKAPELKLIPEAPQATELKSIPEVPKGPGPTFFSEVPQAIELKPAIEIPDVKVVPEVPSMKSPEVKQPVLAVPKVQPPEVNLPVMASPKRSIEMWVPVPKKDDGSVPAALPSIPLAIPTKLPMTE